MRLTLLKRVRGQIEDGKRSALQDLAYIELDIHEQPGAIDPPWQSVNPEDEQQEYPVKPGTTPQSMYDENESLLILGEPGSGKTTMLLDIGGR